MKNRQVSVLKVISLGSDLFLPGSVVSVELSDDDFNALAASGFIVEFIEPVTETSK